MEELEQILREHAQRYPKMQPTDAVKLIYQNEFGGGHLIRDEAACLEYLRREYASIEKDHSVPLYEEIGNGIVRVNLTAIQESDLEKLGQDFIRSAAAHKGDMDSFLRKLAILEHMTKLGIFSFDAKEMEDYLAEYKKANCPMVSHSSEYRSNYNPAYRIKIKKDYP